MIDAAGIGCEPASAATLAGIRRLVAQRVIRPSQSVVAVLTGHLLKDPQTALDFHTRGRRRGSNPPFEIDADLRAVERILER